VAEAPLSDAPRRWRLRVVAALAGALLVGAFAPFDHWWLALLCPALQLLLWRQARDRREAAWLGFFFGTGLYAAGTWWLFISIRVYGQAPVWVALLVMSALVLIMALYQAALGYAVVRWLAPRSAVGALLLVPCAWVLVEWWRGWFLSGFPWLSLGYSQTDTWIAGLAPVGGVHLLSLALLMGAGALVIVFADRTAMRAVALVAGVLPWTIGLALQPLSWTHPAGGARSVAILQGAVPQDMKWLVSNQQRILDEYARLHRAALGADLIVWPESALPDLANLYAQYLGDAWSAAQAQHSTVLIGVMRQADNTRAADEVYFNSVVALGAGDPVFYDKRHLVPFGEYFPVPQLVRNWLRLMSLPYSDFTPGATRQAPIRIDDYSVAPNICYEDAYPELLNDAARAANVLVTVTNDAWFGRSSARYQHLQIARMRALESRRYLLRAANDGVSAVVDPYGKVQARAPEYEPAVLRSRFTPLAGSTPYLQYGNWLVIGACACVLLARGAATLRTRARGTMNGF
jgi:apolipoprotein N-acyltransferase